MHLWRLYWYMGMLSGRLRCRRSTWMSKVDVLGEARPVLKSPVAESTVTAKSKRNMRATTHLSRN